MTAPDPPAARRRRPRTSRSPPTPATGCSLADLRGRRVVLYAYPAAMTPGCTTQACDFRDSLSSLNAAGVEVVGISPDPPEKLAKFRARDGLTFPLVSDPDKAVLTAYGAYGEKQNYGRTVMGVIRSTFVIDAEGRIERAMYNVKATGHVAKLRRDLGLGSPPLRGSRADAGAWRSTRRLPPLIHGVGRARGGGPGPTVFGPVRRTAGCSSLTA